MDLETALAKIIFEKLPKSVLKMPSVWAPPIYKTRTILPSSSD
jgi:hypothetical protein